MSLRVSAAPVTEPTDQYHLGRPSVWETWLSGSVELRIGAPYGNRTRVSAVKGMQERPQSSADIFRSAESAGIIGKTRPFLSIHVPPRILDPYWTRIGPK